jgi:phosphatidylinositol alpha-1,6-mannosyltransferase
MKKKIALVTSGVGTQCGGIGVVTEMMVSALRPDHDIVIWVHPPFWPRLLRISLVTWRTLWGSLRRPDVVIYDHIHLAVLHKLIPWLAGVPYVVFLHGVEVWQPLHGRRREALLRANLLLTNSATTESTARAVNPWLPQVKVTWLGVPHQERPADVSSAPPVGLIVGRMVDHERYKGHDAIMDAWPRIRAAIPDAKLMILGKGNDAARLRARVENENLEGIEFLGYVTDAQRDQIYRSCRLLFLASKGEGFGLAATEAASFGVPVLGLAGTVTEELFPSGKGAVLAKDLDGGSIAQAAIPVLGDAQRAAELGRSGRARVESLFLERHFIDRFRAAFLPLISS